MSNDTLLITLAQPNLDEADVPSRFGVRHVADTPITELPELGDDAVYLVTLAAPDPDAASELATYQQAAGPLAASHGGRPVAQLPVSGQPVGHTPARFAAIAEFPSAEAVQTFLADPGYVAVTDARDRRPQETARYIGDDHVRQG